jgi:hypothetical protein
VFVLVTIIFQIMFSQQNVNHVFLFNDASKDNFTVTFMRTMFYLFPSFTVSVCFGAVALVASTHMDPASVTWVKGLKYSWADFFKPDDGWIVGGIHWTAPSGFEFMMILVYDALFFLLLTWYFDHVVSHNRGVAE